MKGAKIDLLKYAGRGGYRRDPLPMRFLWRANVHGWVMTGVIGKDAAWFIGFSKRPQRTDEEK